MHNVDHIHEHEMYQVHIRQGAVRKVRAVCKRVAEIAIWRSAGLTWQFAPRRTSCFLRLARTLVALILVAGEQPENDADARKDAANDALVSFSPCD